MKHRASRQSSTRNQGAPAPRQAIASRGAGSRKAESGGTSIARHAQRLWPAAGLILLAFFVYLPALRAGFIWDDNALTANPHVTSSGGLWKIWLAPGQMAQEQHYWPLVYTTFWLEHLVFGLRPFIYHLDNILLHALATVLLWRVLRRMEVPGAWLGAALFAVHPVHAESVAWIIERKDVLSGALYFGAALAYLRFECGMRNAECGIQNTEPRMQNETARITHHSPQATHSAFQVRSPGETSRPHSAFYILALVLFTGAMLSKSIAVTFPLALGLVLWWRLGQLTKRDLAALAPFALIALGLTIADMHYYHGRQLAGFENSGLSLAGRAQMVGGALWIYLSKLAWPWPLATFYHKWHVGAASPLAWLPLAAWLGLIGGLWLTRRRIGRGPFAALAFFTLTLAPVLGLIDFDFLAFAWIADRFQYLASAGPLALTAAGLAALAARRQWPQAARRCGAAALLGALSVLCLAQASLYRDSETLFRASIARQPRSWAACNHLAFVLSQSGRGEEAVRMLREGLAGLPQPDPRMTLELANALKDQKQYQEAEEYYQQTLRLKPDFVEGMIHYGAFLAGRERYVEAAAQYQTALKLSPDNAMVLCNLGNILREKGKLAEAEVCLARAVDRDPKFAGYRVNLAQALADQKKFGQAIEQCRRALQLDPENLDGHFMLGQLLLLQGQYAQAARHLEEAVRLQPDAAGAFLSLGKAHQGMNNTRLAIRCYQEALRIKPDLIEASSRLQTLGIKAEK